MSTTLLFKKVDYSLNKLIHDIAQGEIGLPDIQRPFVWKTSRVRDLFDSMYRGFPVGYLLFWSNAHLKDKRQIGIGSKQAKIPSLLIVDGQQRLTALYAVLKGQPTLTKEFRESYIQIAFRPRDEMFEVTDAAIQRDPEFIPNISQLWSGDIALHRFTKDFIKRLRKSRELTEEEEDTLAERINRLFDIQNYPFTAMEIDSTVDEEQVSEIFVRINSQGVTLKQADFILTLLSVFWDEGRAQLEKFCRDCRQPPAVDGAASPFNYFMQPAPDQMLRVCVGLGFKRARLQYVYSILRGKDLETGEVSDEQRIAQFEKLKEAQVQALNLTNWHEFQKILLRAGFRSKSMITSDLGLLHTYVIFLIGKHEFNIDSFELRNIMARWFFMSALTSNRHTGSPESVMESDLARLRSVNNPEEFIGMLSQIIKDTLTEDFWNISLVNSLESSSARTPVVFAYHAALNLLDAQVLFSNMKVSDLLDPALKPKRSATERHHLFSKGYLKKLGITEVRDTNQVANYALVEWGDNMKISDKPPSEYFPIYRERFKYKELAKMMEWHGLPDNWEKMEYVDFLAKRRKLIAKVIRQGFDELMS
jgi:hypothetical protein